MTRRRLAGCLAGALFVAGLAGPTAGFGAPPVIERIPVDETFEDEALSEACGVAVTSPLADVAEAARAGRPDRGSPRRARSAASRRPRAERYVPPLRVYVIWHPRFADGAPFANDIYLLLHGAPFAPFSRHLGIPVYFRSVPLGSRGAQPAPIPFEGAARNVVVPLVDEQMMKDLDGEGWRDYLQSIVGAERTRIVPFAFTPSATAAFDAGDASWGLMLDKSPSEQLTELRRRLLFALAAHLLEGRRSSAEKRRLTLFLSHATADAGEEARWMREQLAGKFPLDVFFDKLDIPVGDDFAKLIRAEIDPAKRRGAVVFVALLSDSYSSRDWCQREVLLAKQARCPMLVVHKLLGGEERSFPYTGNVPSDRKSVV